MTIPRSERVDAHQHFWNLARGDYGWITPDLAPLHRDFGPEDLAPLLERHDIRHTVLVSAAPTAAETSFLLDVAEQTPFVAGVVGWVELEREDAASEIGRLARRAKLAGIRPMLQDSSDDRFVLRKDLSNAIAALEEHHLAFDALVRPRHLPHLLEFVRLHPALTVVIDHAAKPTIRRRPARFREFDAWRRDLIEIARHPRTWCKLSGLVTEAESGVTVEDLVPIVDVVFEAFGPQRILWGSDWPVVTLERDYSEWFEMTETLIAALGEDERAAILGGNATRCYGLAARVAAASP